MKTFARSLVAIALFVPTAFNAPAVLGGTRENLGVTSVELAQLPQFCWAQMGVPGSAGPGYSIPKTECGWLTNHYCPGLVSLIRFKSSANKSQHLSLLGRADTDIRYTEHGIKDYPKCSIREHVTASKAEVQTLLSIYGKRPKRPTPSR